MIGHINAMPIRWKLVLIALLTTALVQLFAGVILSVYDSQVFRAQKSHEVEAEAAILASSVTAALTFGDVKVAHEYLDALKANAAIEAAGVYGPDGALFTSYDRDGGASQPVPARAQPIGQYFHGDQLTVFAPVIEGTTALGSVYLRAAITPVWIRLRHYGGIVLLTLAGSLMIAVPISMYLNRSISGRIHEIAVAAARITAGDLTQDIAPTEQPDEVGRLCTAFRQMVKSLRETNAELERRVRLRTADLAAANKELEAFSYSVSHDLRAPLRAIDGFSLMIEEDYAGRLDAEGNRLLSVVRSNAHRMGTLIDDLLAFSKLGRQSTNSVHIDMTELAREVCLEIQATPSSSRVEFDIASVPAARGDRPMLKQVWANLLSNAVKYSATRDRPAVKVSGEATESDVIYRICDNGVGFDMRYYDKLFGVFQRLHASAEFSGSGVGLAIVQRIIVRHGGHVWAEGEVDVGATFFFSLPKP
jgi:signal transduction histidine kinase